MFRRRRSSSHHHQPLSSSSAQSAQSAASHAFLKSRPSSSSLSSAAAATALRNLTPPPTDVENVQTKRMIQRQSSVSSQPSSSATLRSPSRNGLRRSNSSNSMTTRTFREQSPRRPVSSSGPGPVKTAPPIPSIPKEYTGRSTPVRRSVSVGGSMRSSPPVKHPSGRGGSVDRENIRTASPSLYTVPEAQRTGSKSSINFSYPINSRPNSPSQPPEASDGRDVSTGALLTDRLAGLSASKTQGTPSQPANTSARRRTRNSSPGSPGKSTAPVTTAVAAAQAAIVPSSPSVTTERRESEVREPVPTSTPSSPESKPSPSRPALMKRPSTVREDYRGEEQAEANAPGKIHSAPRTGRVTPEGPSTAQIPLTPDMGRDSPQSSVLSSPESPASAEIGHGLQPSPLRQASSSPGRSTRFSAQLSVTGVPGELLHKPPPRSVSPVKSAMKSSRVSSLSPDGRTGGVLRPGPPLSEISDGTSAGSDDGSKPGFRKKTAKVSFDDEAEVVGVAASPPTSPESVVPDSPPGSSKSKSKSHWFGLGKKKYNARNNTVPDDFDEVLKPRPVLPSFGSIRGTREGEQPEPVRHEFSDNESTTSSEPNLGGAGWSFSSDHAIGSVLSNNEHNDTRAASEHHELATPPEIAVKSGQPGPSSQPAYVAEPTDQGHVRDTPGALDDESNHPNSSPALRVPGIAVQPATPELEKERSSLDWCTVPGDFPRASLESKSSSRRKGKKPVDNFAARAVEDQDTDDESGESIYSDAEEGLDGDGFGSINAIVDGSAGPTENELVNTDREGTKSIEPVDQPSDSMSVMPETCQIARVETTIRDASPPPLTRSPASPQEPLPFSSPYPPFPTRPSAKKSNTEEQIPRQSLVANSARRSMSADAYEGPAPQDIVAKQNGSTRAPSADEQKPVKTRPASWGAGLLKSKEAISEEKQGVNGHGAHGPQRRLSNGSDSSSSFVRSSRPARASPQYIMRRTMRGIPPPHMQSTSPIRQKSPPPDMRPQSSGSGPAGALRTTLRGNETRREKPSFFSTGKMQKAKVTKAPGSLFTSRYPDSDEDHGSKVVRSWQSRYENSSDDEPEMNNLRPVRGIPRRAGKDDGDSTELEDSSDGERHRPAASATARKPSEPASPKNPALAAVAKSRGMTEKEAEDFLRRPNIERRPSLFHRLSIRKPKSSAERGSSAKLGKLDSDQVREEPILDPNQGSTVTTITANPGTPSSPRLLKRGAYRSSGGESWPLRGPPKELINGNHASERPQTADGAGQNGSTAVNDHATLASKDNENPQGLSTGIKSDGQQTVADNHSTPRKKRFPKIRKAFGLRG